MFDMNSMETGRVTNINNTIFQIMDVSTKVILDGEIIKSRNYEENPNDMILTIINTKVNKIHVIVGKNKISLWNTVKTIISFKNLNLVLM